ncbi:D-alanine--D-alanine ligase [bacterium]|nr:D-alanine--D-alanine ligase [bacterium]
MIIGITYDLRVDYLAEGYSLEETAEFDKLETIEAIENALILLGFKTDRIGHIRNLTCRLVNGDRWDFVFNIAEGLKGFGRESQVPCLLDAYNIPYTFSDPLTLSLSLHKGMTKCILSYLGIPTPAFAVIETEKDIGKIDLPFPLFAKPVAEGTGKGINPESRIQDKNELVSVCSRLLKQYNQPVLVETFLPGREFTVGIVGTGEDSRDIGAMEILIKNNEQEAAYSYSNKENYEKLVDYRLVSDASAEKAKQLALAAWRGLGCRDAGRIDIREDASGLPNIIEINPLAGLHPKHSDLPILCKMVGIKYVDLIKMIMESAVKRREDIKKL